MDNCGCSTHVVFTAAEWSPRSYSASEINGSLIEHMRRGFDDNCPWQEMLDSSTRAFNLWTDGGAINQTKLAELDAIPVHEWTVLDDLGKYVQSSGYNPGSTHCPLLARKFAGERKGILLKTMLDCDGGGLASHCPHPRTAKAIH